MKDQCFPRSKVCTDDLTEEAELLKILSDRSRLRIFVTLLRSRGEVCVCDFVEGLDLLQPTVSHHLKVLKEAGLIEPSRRGTWVYYRLSPGARARVRTTLGLLLSRKVAAA
jgi:DNA-binding transcriptional ArsR family regulator